MGARKHPSSLFYLKFRGIIDTSRVDVYFSWTFGSIFNAIGPRTAVCQICDDVLTRNSSQDPRAILDSPCSEGHSCNYGRLK